MCYVINTEERTKAIEQYDWKSANEEKLRWILEYTKFKEVREKAIKTYDWDNATEEEWLGVKKKI